MRATRRTILTPQSGTRLLTRRIATEDGHGWTTESAGRESYTYEILLDMAELDLMAERAAKNKGGACRDGALEVRILTRQVTR